MSQKRNKTGRDFEKQVCLQRGLTHKSKDPKIKWSGEGKNMYEKIVSTNFDVSEFYPLNDSKYEKYDAITTHGSKIEIKKYLLFDISSWCLYSEPFPSVKSRKYLEYIINNFGNGSLEESIMVYNKFIKELLEKNFDYIISRMIESNIGIQLIDAFIPNNYLEFRINIEKGWMGFSRAQIQFRKKEGINIQTQPPIRYTPKEKVNLFKKAKEISKSRKSIEAEDLKSRLQLLMENSSISDSEYKKEFNKILRKVVKLVEQN